MKLNIQCFVLLAALLLASSLHLSSSARESGTVNLNDDTQKSDGAQFRNGANFGHVGGGSSLQGPCYGGQCSGYGGWQGGYRGGQGGYVEPKCGELGCCYYTHGFCAKCCDPPRSRGGYQGRQGGCGGSYGSGQGGYPSYRGSQGHIGRGFVEPQCGELGCCYYTHGFCAKCCDPWWVPPGAKVNQVKPEKMN